MSDLFLPIYTVWLGEHSKLGMDIFSSSFFFRANSAKWSFCWAVVTIAEMDSDEGEVDVCVGEWAIG